MLTNIDNNHKKFINNDQHKFFITFLSLFTDVLEKLLRIYQKFFAKRGHNPKIFCYRTPITISGWVGNDFFGEIAIDDGFFPRTIPKNFATFPKISEKSGPRAIFWRSDLPRFRQNLATHPGFPENSGNWPPLAIL